LSNKARDGELKVVEDLQFAEPKTKEMVKILSALGIESTVLVVDSNPEMNMIKSARNLSEIKTLRANLLNVVDLLSYKVLVMTEGAVHNAEELWGK
jgi:large subunit ribosomal protein L4